MYFELLRLFAFGTFREYLEHKEKLPELSPVMKKKLQHLTIVSLATKMKVSSSYLGFLILFCSCFHTCNHAPIFSYSAFHTPFYCKN